MAADSEVTETTKEPSAPIKPTIGGIQDHTDGRQLWQWESKYPLEARQEMNFEAYLLIAMLAFSFVGAGIFIGLADQHVSIPLGDVNFSVSFSLLTIFFAGSVGGVTFSIKWLIHSVAKGKWHLDRRYWRLMTPMIGGAYACVVTTLFTSGLFAAHNTLASSTGIGPSAAVAFLVGYFSDGVSGLLSNIANAMFGTLEKK